MSLTGCTQAEIEDSKAIMIEDLEVTLQSAASKKAITIYADGKWMADATESWLSVTPNNGEGTMELTLSADENPGEDVREAKVILRGGNLINDIEILVRQNVNTHRNVTPVTVTEALSLTEKALAKIEGCQVMAVTNGGFVISDNTSNLFVNGSASVEVGVGDMVAVTGEIAKINEIIGMNLYEVYVESTDDVTYPEAKDVTEEAAYAPGKVEYVSITASCVGEKLTINGKIVASIFKPVNSVSALNKRDVVLTGYYIGTSSNAAVLAMVSSEDKGATPLLGKPLPFNDNFDWVEPLVQWDIDNGRTTGDSMGDKKTVNYGNAYAIPDFEPTFTGLMGYESMFYDSKTVYVCGGNYLKFSKTNNCNGVRLPAFAIEGTEDLLLSFDWGKNTGDNVVLVVEIEGKGSINGESVSDKLTVGSAFTWKSESIRINGADAETRICIRPTAYTGKVSSDGSLYRWFLDNVEVVSLKGMSEAEIQVSGLENEFIVFEGLEPTDVSFKVNSTSDYSLSTTVDWLHLDVTEGVAFEEKTITVKCDESQLSTTRKGEIIIKSGLTTKSIAVIQSAAGQALDPLISVICSKPTDALLGEGDEFSVAVQANVEYEVAISDEWIKAVEAPATKASVEKTEHSFALDVNVSGAPRTGFIRFYNKESKVEAVVVVKQENFEPRIDLEAPRQLGFIPAEGKSVTINISSNIDYAVASDLVTSVSGDVAGDREATVTIPANTGATRKVELVFSNDKYGYSSRISFTQLGNDVLLADDFAWLASLEELYSAANSGKLFGQSVEDNNPSGNAPNAYTAGGLKNDVFKNEFTKQGYVDLNPSAKVIYPQHYYLKMGKTGNTTGLILPEINLSAASSVNIEFNWACHRRVVSEVHETDPVDIVVEVKEGDTVVYTSEVFKTAQPLGKMEWQTVKLSIPSVAPGQRISVHPVDMKPGSNVVPRWYIDNILITK